MKEKMSKREAVEEIARTAGTLHVCETARKALRGEVTLDRALHEAVAHTTRLHAKNVAERAIDGGKE